MTAGFQTQVYNQPVQAFAGDFCSVNPWWSFDAGPGGLVAGAAGLTIGRFAWTFPPVDSNGTNQIALNAGVGPVSGFVHRAQQGLNTTFLSNAGNLIPQGLPVTLMTGGDFWVVNDGATEALLGQKAYADFANGKVRFGATATPIAGAAFTASIADNSALSFTGSIAGDVLTVTAVGSGTIVNGAILSGSGVASGTKVGAQISGTAGGVGTYYVNIGEQTVASTTITGTYGVLTVTAVGSGTLGVGQVIAGSGVTTGTAITALGTGAGLTGTYIISPAQGTVGSEAMTSVLDVETKWVAMSTGLAGELVKISSQPLG